MDSKLIFKEPPEDWESYLPLGNGRLGAMVKAHPCNEVIQLNEEGIWSGGPQDRVNDAALGALGEVRALVRQGKILEAQELGFRCLSGRNFNERAYQTAGELRVDFFPADDPGIEFSVPPQHRTGTSCLASYSSCLDLDDACVRIRYGDGKGTSYERIVWASAADDMLFMYVKASGPGLVQFRAYFDRGIFCDDMRAEDGRIFLSDSHGIPFCAGAGAVAQGGSVRSRGFMLEGEGCSEVLFFLDVRAWQYGGRISPEEYRTSILRDGWSLLLKERLSRMESLVRKEGVASAARMLFGRHRDEYRSFWNRMRLRIGGGDSSDGAGGTDEACASGGFGSFHMGPSVAELFDRLRSGGWSRGGMRLVNLYAAFSRYLMIAGSRSPGRLPLTLQGLWNCSMDPPWGSKYTVNINTQMNYWPANMAALGECELPLFTLLERAYENGKDVARRMYGCRGYVVHHNTDFWGDAAPQDSWLPGSYWVLGAAWLATHVWEHYEYWQDLGMLRRLYYLIHEACLFFVDFLQPDVSSGLAADGKPFLVVNPSVSPENSYRLADGRVASFCEGCQMDSMVLTHLFSCQREAARAVEENGGRCADTDGRGYPAEDFAEFAFVLSHLKPPRLNGDGTIMEWDRPLEEQEKGHRHMSHLYGLFPGHSISPEKTPALAVAAERTLRRRISFGGGHTGWSQAWIINFWASLLRGDEAGEAVRNILLRSTLPNLLDSHPPFQIDGNFGALAGILRMLVQSELSAGGKARIRLLPALPSAPEWQNGELEGVRVKGGGAISFRWRDGKPYDVRLEGGGDFELV